MHITLLILAFVFVCIHAEERLEVVPIVPELAHKTFITDATPTKDLDLASYKTATPNDPKATALAFVSQVAKLSPKDYVVTKAYTSEDLGITHVYLRQLYKGLQVLNGDINISVDSKGSIISYGNSFFPSANAQNVKDDWSAAVTPSEAFNTLAAYLNLPTTPANVQEKPGASGFELQGIPSAKGPVKAERAYLELSDKELVPVWRFNLRMTTDNWFDACVRADGSKVVFLNDWVSDYAQKTASKRHQRATWLAWTGTSAESFIEHAVAASLDLAKESSAIHDIFCRNGFNEAAGNSGINVIVESAAQDGISANFASPPDGEHGRMRIFAQTTGSRAELNIIIHEYTHGLTNRLTGGSANSNCLSSGQAAGMGEGWSDTVAFLLQMNEKSRPEDDVIMGTYVLNDPNGIRTYPYSTDTTKNPLTYAYVMQDDWSEAHRAGEIWANTLFNVYWELSEQMNYKFNSDWYSADVNSPNTLLLQILIQGMKLQPCRPTFLTARDAIIKATGMLNRSATCAIWRGFAKKGMGPKAKDNGGSVVVEDYSVPSNCK